MPSGMRNSARYDFREFQNTWIAELELALSAKSFPPGERFYGLAFFMFYAERGSVILPPMVSLGGEQDWVRGTHGEEARDAGFGSFRWNPADWSLVLYEPNSVIRSAYERLSQHACGGRAAENERGQRHEREYLAHWDATHVEYLDVMAKLCRELTRRAQERESVFRSMPVTEDFVAVVCDPSLGRQGEELLMACVEGPMRARLFPGLA